MEFIETAISGAVRIVPDPHEDHRGFFMRTYDDQIFKEHGLHRDWVQENHSFSKLKGTIRGMHFQFPPHSETKLIRAVTGEIFIAYVDLRRDSASFGTWGSTLISESNKNILFVPRGLALGMCTLSDNATLLYKMDNYYTPGTEGSVRWDDPEIGIEWPIADPVISEKDTRAGSFREFKESYGGLAV